MNQSEFLAIMCNFLKARENWRAQGAIGFGFLIFGWKTGARFVSQSVSVAIAIVQLLSTGIWKLLYPHSEELFFTWIERCSLGKAILYVWGIISCSAYSVAWLKNDCNREHLIMMSHYTRMSEMILWPLSLLFVFSNLHFVKKSLTLFPSYALEICFRGKNLVAIRGMFVSEYTWKYNTKLCLER